MKTMLRWLVPVTALCVSTQVIAQERPTLKRLDQRLQRVEKVMDQSLLELLQEIEALKRQVRELRGELEAQNYELDREKKRNQDRFLQTEQRLTVIEQPVEGDAVEGDSEPTEPTSLEPSGSLDTDDLPVFVRENETQSASASAPLNKPLNGPLNGPLDDDALTSEVAVEVARESATEAEKTAYTNVHRLLTAGEFDAAVTGFGEFLVKYPVGSFSDNAWYWQGEALYAQRKFNAAIENFETVISAFPSSPKVPGAQLKVGFAQYEQQQFKSARNTLNEVSRTYPNQKAGELAQQRLREMNQQGL